MSNAPGLRERKKTETRAAIQQTVLFLALGRGLDAVTADEIAAAANVSVRTFHNYFGSKEEALVTAWVGEFEVYVDALRNRPADEPILDALEHVFGVIASRIEERPGQAEVHADLLWTSVAMARYRSVLLDEAIRMVPAVVAEGACSPVTPGLGDGRPPPAPAPPDVRASPIRAAARPAAASVIAAG